MQDWRSVNRGFVGDSLEPLLMSPAPFEQTAYLPWCDISWDAGVTKHLFVSVRRT